MKPLESSLFPRDNKAVDFGFCFVLFKAVTVKHVEQMKLSFVRWVVYWEDPFLHQTQFLALGTKTAQGSNLNGLK